VYVSEFSISGGSSSKDLATSLQGLLASRLNPDLVQLVKTQVAAELVVAGSYTAFGKIFSLDAQISGTARDTVQKVFEQGESQDDLIPAVGRLAQKLDREFGKIYSAATAPSVAPLIATDTKTEPVNRNLPQVWTSPPLEGVLTGIAIGRTLPTGEREIFAAGEQIIRYYRLGEKMKLVSEIVLSGAAKILAIDTADLDGDGIPEIYVTIIDRETLISQVFLPKETGLEKIAGELPYFFRGIGTDLKNRAILAQMIGVRGNFYGDIQLLEKSENRFTAGRPQKMPIDATVFTVNRFTDASGKVLHLVMSDTGIIMVSAPDGTVVWKSSDSFGGSEQHFKQENSDAKRSEDHYRWTFLEQRMLITAEGDIIVPHNKGSFNIGTFRSYNKHTIHSLRWNGSILEEAWHTGDNPTYLADFGYDSSAKELILLKITQKEGIWSKGRSVISIHKTE
jgi:hypothetical protein